MAGGNAHLINVQGTYALLDGSGKALGKGRVLLAQEIGLKRNHAGINEKQVRVIQDQRGAWYCLVTRIDEVLGKPFPDLMSLHEQQS